MRNVIVQSRYARALFMTTEPRNETAQALLDLKGLVKVLDPGGRVASYLSSPGLRLEDKRAALRHSLDGKVLRIVAVFVDLLLRKRRLSEFDGIVDEYEALSEAAQGIKRAHVASAVPLTDAEVEKLHKELEAYTKSSIKLTREVTPELIGGAQVRIGDVIVDRTVRNLLDTITKHLFEVSV